MWPAFDLPVLHWTIRTDLAMLALAATVANLIGPSWAAALEGISAMRVRLALPLLGVIALLGGHLHYVLSYGLRGGSFAAPWNGLHAAGAVLAIGIGAPPLFRLLRLPIGRTADGLSPTVALGVGIARVGCFFQGCCHGRPCTYAWCVAFPGTNAPVHPLQLYFSGGALLLVPLALLIRRHKRYDGQVALGTLAAFSALSFLLEFARGEFAARVYWGPLPQLAWFASMLGASSVFGLWIGGRRARERASQAPHQSR